MHDMIMDVTPKKMNTLGLRTMRTNKDTKESQAFVKTEHAKTPHRTPKRDTQYQNLFSSPILYDGHDKTPERHVGWDDGACNALLDDISPRIPRKRTRRCPEFVLQRNAKSMPLSTSEIEKEEYDMKQFAELANSLRELPNNKTELFEISDTIDDSVNQSNCSFLDSHARVPDGDYDDNCSNEISSGTSVENFALVTEDKDLDRNGTINEMMTCVKQKQSIRNDFYEENRTRVKNYLNSKQESSNYKQPSTTERKTVINKRITQSCSCSHEGSRCCQQISTRHLNRTTLENNNKFAKASCSISEGLPKACTEVSAMSDKLNIEDPACSPSIIGVSTGDDVVIDLLDDSSNEIIVLCTQEAEEKFLHRNEYVNPDLMIGEKFSKPESTIQHTVIPNIEHDDLIKYPNSASNRVHDTCISDSCYAAKKIANLKLPGTHEIPIQNIAQKGQDKFHSLTRSKSFPVITEEMLIPSSVKTNKPKFVNDTGAKESFEKVDLSKSSRRAEFIPDLLTTGTELLKSLDAMTVQNSASSTSLVSDVNTTDTDLLDDSSNEIIALLSQAAEEQYLCDVKKEPLLNYNRINDREFNASDKNIRNNGDYTTVESDDSETAKTARRYVRKNESVSLIRGKRVFNSERNYTGTNGYQRNDFIPSIGTEQIYVPTDTIRRYRSVNDSNVLKNDYYDRYNNNNNNNNKKAVENGFMENNRQINNGLFVAKPANGNYFQSAEIKQFSEVYNKLSSRKRPTCVNSLSFGSNDVNERNKGVNFHDFKHNTIKSSYKGIPNDKKTLLEEENEIFDSLNFDYLESLPARKPDVKPVVIKTYSNLEIEKRRMEARQKLLRKYASQRNM